MLAKIIDWSVANKFFVMLGSIVLLVLTIRLLLLPLAYRQFRSSRILANLRPHSEEISQSFEAEIRLVPFSYFWTCWKVSPSASPNPVWVMWSIMRRIRTLAPTCLSVGLGSFLTEPIDLFFIRLTSAS
mgnify:CR=1 FL=1